MNRRKYSIPLLLGAIITGCSGLSATSEAGPSGRDTGSIFTEAGVPEAGDKNPGGKIYYVRPKGGSAAQCTGLANADYPGSGSGGKQDCALSHPFWLLPPGGKALLAGGDWLIIASGEYRMGQGAPGAVGCTQAGSYDCHMPPLPSGPSVQRPTRVLGAGWDSGCQAPPRLYGSGRPWYVLNLIKSSNIHLQCLEVTDNSGCVESHSGSQECQRDTPPYGDWASVGLHAEDSANVVLRQVNIHGLGHAGVHAGRLKDWLLEDVSISGNGSVGWDGDLANGTADTSNSGTLMFRRVTIQYNGCGETYPGGKPAGCWAQEAGGYGDGLGTGSTGGDWIFEDCRFLHNTSDGLDLLYHEKGGKVVLRRTLAEGNAGNQVKVTGKDVLIENSVLVGNCAYFEGKSFTYKVDHCRALGNTLSLGLQAGSKVSLYNSSLYGQGDVLITATPRFSTCNGSEQLAAVNNILVGDTDYFQNWEQTAVFWTEGCPGLKLSSDYNVVHRLKGTCKSGAHDLCADPLLGQLSGEAYDMAPKKNSPAVNTGLKVGGAVPANDLLKRTRPFGDGVDRGAYEIRY